MRVYIVTAYVENYENRDSWISGVFASQRAAVKHINDQSEKFAEDIARITELENLVNIRELTDVENEEYRQRNNRWAWSRNEPTYHIDDFELQGVGV